MVQTRAMLRRSGGKLCGGFVPPRRRAHTLVTREISNEIVLRDAIDVVCKYLNVGDLLAVSQVCSFWKAAVARQLSKRRQIQRLLMPENPQNLHLPSELRVKPSVALLFVSSKLAETASSRPANIVNENSSSPSGPPASPSSSADRLSTMMSHYRRQLPHKLVGLEICQPLTDAADEHRGILGLFFPDEKELRVRVSWCQEASGSMSQAANRVLDELNFGDLVRDDESATLLFARSLPGYFLAEQVISCINRRYPDQNEHIWGGLVGKELRATTCHSDESPSDTSKILVGLRISSSGLRTWMTVIDCTAAKDEIAYKLRDFKQQIVEKRHRLGLAYGPHYIRSRNRNSENFFSDGHDLMRAIKAVFTDIPFTGMFSQDSRILVGCNAMDEDISQRMDQDNIMALIVIAYD